MDIIDRLHEAVKASGIPKKAVALRAGMNASELSRILNHKKPSVRAHEIEAIARAINVPMAVLYSDGPLPNIDLKRTREALRTLTELVDRHDATVHPTPAKPLPDVSRVQQKRLASRTVLPFRGQATPNAVLFDDEDLKRKKIPADLWERGARHAVRVVGDSMIDAGIKNGATVYFRPTRNTRAARGKIVVCRVNGAVYLKRLQIVGNQIHLLSENGELYAPLIVNPEDDVEQYGVVVLPLPPAE